MNSRVIGCHLFLSYILLAFFVSGCQLVNNVVQGDFSDSDGGMTPVVPPAVEIPTLIGLNIEVGDCHLGPPEALPYLCQISSATQYAQSLATEKQSDNKSAAAEAINFELINNSCIGLSIDGAGRLEGSIINSESEICSVTVRASLGSLVTEESLTMTVNPSINFAFDSSNLFLKAGEAATRVNLMLSSPAPYDTYVEFDVFGDTSEFVSGLEFGTKRISILTGQTNVAIDFSVPTSAGLTTPVYQLIRLKNGSTTALPALSLNSYSEATVLPVFDKISSGLAHSCAIDSGKLFCWGHSSQGQVGNGYVPSFVVASPARIGSSANWSAISAGGAHSCGINNNDLYCWGHDGSGQLGNGNGNSASVFTPELIDNVKIWTHISAGSDHSCGLAGGKLFCWGQDASGQVGNGNASGADVTAPEEIVGSSGWTHISAGGNHTCGIDGGSVYCWGIDTAGQLGNGSGTSSDVDDPQVVPGFTGWTEISVGTNHSCGINPMGLFCWGFGVYGELGNGGGGGSNESSPYQVGVSTAWTNVTVGLFHTCARDSNKLFCWGRDELGQIGDGGMFGDAIGSSSVLSPSEVDASISWSAVDAGFDHTCALGDGHIYCWGYGTKGRIGNGVGSAGRLIVPTLVDPAAGWSKVAAGQIHSCGIKAGSLYCWGEDDEGQAGNGSLYSAHVNIPHRIGLSTSWIDIAAGSFHSCGIDGGKLFCWGEDTNGKLGNGNSGSVQQDEPVWISNNLNDWTVVSLGQDHSCGIEQGRLFCWGSDGFGQLGNGAASGADEEAPEQVGMSNLWSDISLGESHSCGIKAGELFCWGLDGDGQMGNGSGSTGNISAPARVGSSQLWTQVKAGQASTCGIDGGQLYCWGKNSSGQIANGIASSTDEEDPVKVGVSNAWTQLAVGHSHVCAVNNELLYCWGSNFNGQIGSNTNSPDNILNPVPVAASNLWTQVSAGEYHSCGISSGQLFCWGSDDHAQTGASTSLLGSPFLLIDW